MLCGWLTLRKDIEPRVSIKHGFIEELIKGVIGGINS